MVHEDIESLKKTLEEAKTLSEERLNAWKRAAADFENYKKRRHKEDEELVVYSKQLVLFKLLPVLEAMEQALRHAPRDEANQLWSKGMDETIGKFMSAIAELGVERIKTVGQKFNHALHEATDLVEGSESGMITEEVSPGYIINGHVVKPAKVKVAK